jgi:hypothetical protein
MIPRVFFGLVLLVLLLSSQAFSQATVESGLANSAAGNAAAKTGSALGNALSNPFDKSTQKLSNATEAPAQPNPTPVTTTVPPAGTNTATATNTPHAPLPARDAAVVQFSVQDVGTSCPPAKDWTQADNQPSADNKLTVCSLHASSGPFPKTKYKPVVDIKF